MFKKDTKYYAVVSCNLVHISVKMCPGKPLVDSLALRNTQRYPCAHQPEVTRYRS